MSSHKSHRHSRGREGDGEHKRSRHGPGHGREGPRDTRDREPRGSSWRDPDNRQFDMVRDGRPAAAPAPSRTTPVKPSAPRTGGTVLGNSALSSALMEAAKRRAQEQAAAAAAAAASDGEDGEIAGARKRPRFDDGAATSDRPSQQESLQERLQREAAEFKQLQHDLPSQVRSHSRASSHSSSSYSGGNGTPQEGQQRKMGRRWQDESEGSEGAEDAEQPQQQRVQQQQDSDQDQGDQQQQEQQQKRSRWMQEDEDERLVAEVEEGEAPLGLTVSAAVDEELEELNRRERADLDADASGDNGVASSPAVGMPAVDDEVTAGLPIEKNMLEESRRVEEYERLNRISEGTYGVVHRARCKATGEIFALKKLKLESFLDGFPQTSVRELNVLLSLHHPNIVNVTEVAIGARNEVYMVMEYVEHDLKYVLELQHKKKAPQFSIGQVKCLMQQLLEGVAYLHDRWVLHRDIKTSNLLYSNEGLLKICDMGLARQYGSPLRAFTPQVVTLWYRSIERLLGEPLYSTALDMWSVGCILADFILCEPLFQGRGELDQIKRIFQLLGTPTQESWPGWDQLPDAKNLQWKPQESQLRTKFPAKAFGIGQALLTETGFDLLSQLLEMNPKKRISAENALKHPWFQESPRPVSPTLMPTFPARHAQGSGKDIVRDKVAKPSPGAVLPAGFGF